MRVGDFELTIRDTEGRTKPETKEGYVALQHGEQYSIAFRNNTAGRCNLKVRVDGHSVGDFQIRPWAYATLERPLDGDGRFTFFAVDSEEAYLAGGTSVASIPMPA